MRRAEGVVFALASLGETRQPAALTQGTDAIASACQDFVRIGLMAHVPDEAVVRRVEDVVDGDRQLDDAQPRPQMAARDRDGVDGFGAQLVGKLFQLLAA